MAALSIAAGRGRKRTYEREARAKIVALAQQDPERRKDGTATWSLSTLQKRLRKEGVEHIGTNTIKRVLEVAGSSYQKTRSWCPTGTAQRVRKTGVVTVVDPETEQKSNCLSMSSGGCRVPRGAMLEHSIENRQELAHAGGQGDLLGFAGLQ